MALTTCAYHDCLQPYYIHTHTQTKLLAACARVPCYTAHARRFVLRPTAYSVTVHVDKSSVQLFYHEVSLVVSVHSSYRQGGVAAIEVININRSFDVFALQHRGQYSSAKGNFVLLHWCVVGEGLPLLFVVRNMHDDGVSVTACIRVISNACNAHSEQLN
jgi:hypothetical protein